MCKNAKLTDFHGRTSFASNLASKISKIAILANFTLGGILSIFAATFQIALARSQMHRRNERGESKFSFKKKIRVPATIFERSGAFKKFETKNRGK